jgi:hypothetical protein
MANGYRFAIVGAAGRCHDVRMTRPEPVRFLRTEATMAFPEGRLLALREGLLHVLAPDGWARLDRERPPGAQVLSRQDAEDWCESQGWDLELLNLVPHGEGFVRPGEG